MSGTQNRMTIGDNIITGNQVFANGPVRIRQQVGTTTEDLRAALDDARDRIVAAGRDEDERARLRSDVEAIERELDRDDPRPAVVHGRWQAILGLLGKAVTHSGDIARIGEIIAGQVSG